MNWTECNIPLRDFTLQPGMVIEVQEYAGEVKRYVIGHMAPDTSSCHGCTRAHEAVPVIRWCMLDWEVL